MIAISVARTTSDEPRATHGRSTRRNMRNSSFSFQDQRFERNPWNDAGQEVALHRTTDEPERMIPNDQYSRLRGQLRVGRDARRRFDGRVAVHRQLVDEPRLIHGGGQQFLYDPCTGPVAGASEYCPAAPLSHRAPAFAPRTTVARSQSSDTNRTRRTCARCTHALHMLRTLGPQDGREDSRPWIRRDSPHRSPTVRKAPARSRRLSPRRAEIRLAALGTAPCSLRSQILRTAVRCTPARRTRPDSRP